MSDLQGPPTSWKPVQSAPSNTTILVCRYNAATGLYSAPVAASIPRVWQILGSGQVQIGDQDVWTDMPIPPTGPAA